VIVSDDEKREIESPEKFRDPNLRPYECQSEVLTTKILGPLIEIIYLLE